MNGSYVDPAVTVVPTEANIVTAVQDPSVGIEVYNKAFERRYRFRHEVIIDGYVYEESLSELTHAIQNVWNTNVPREWDQFALYLYLSVL